MPDALPPLRHALPRAVALARAVPGRLLAALLGGASVTAPKSAPVQDHDARRVLRETGHVYIAIGEDGRVRAWNRASERLFGFLEEQALGRSLEELVVPREHAAAHRAGVEQFKLTGRGRGIGGSIEVDALRADGTTVPVELSIWAQDTADGWVFHALGHDLSERRAHEQVLEVLAEHRQGLLHSRHPDQVRALLCDTARRLAGCQGAYLYELSSHRHDPITGGPVETAGRELRLVAQSLSLADPGAPRVPATDALLRRLMRRSGDSLWVTHLDGLSELEAKALTATGLSSFAIDPLHHEGRLLGVLVLGWLARRERPAELDHRVLSLLSSEAVMVVERLDLQAQLEVAARTDPLTGLLNRRALGEELERCLAERREHGRPLCLAMLDLDRFKDFNDRHGHPAGDALLIATTRAWRDRLHADARLGRLGGDEFAVLLPGSDEEAAREVLRALVAATPSEIGVTAGLATAEDGDTATSLVSRADTALYARKRRRPSRTGPA